MVENLQGLGEKDVCFVGLVIHVTSLHEDAVELDRPGMQRGSDLQSPQGELEGKLPVSLFEVDLTQVCLVRDVSIFADKLSFNMGSHSATPDSILDLSTVLVFAELLGQHAVRQVPQPVRPSLGDELNVVL